MARAIVNTAISDFLGSWAQALLLLDPNLQILFGAENLRMEGAAGMIVIVPTHDAHDGATNNFNQPSAGQKVLRQCWCTFEFNIWGLPSTVAGTDGHDMFDDAYAIKSEVVQCLQDTVGGGNYRLGNGHWLNKGQDDGGEGEETMQYGRWYVLEVQFYNPIVRAIPGTAVISAFPETLQFTPPINNPV